MKKAYLMLVFLSISTWLNSAMADVAFCIGNTSDAYLSAQTLNEFGVTITEVKDTSSTEGTIVARANNHYGSGAGEEWKSLIPGKITLEGGKCYNVAMMSKFTSPNPQTGWHCDAMNATQTPGQTYINSFIFTETAVIQQGSMNLLAQPTKFSTDAPSINCYGVTR
jgi:hypothetical protein